MRSNVRGLLAFVVCALVWPSASRAEVTKVTIANRAVVAGGQAFGQVGPYEKLTGTIEFALDPADKHNSRIVDLEHATRGADGRVHFSADLYVLRPVDTQKGNGVLLFEIANRGRKGLLGRFNRGASGSQDPTAAADFGDGFLMKEGYTLVWVGWQFDVQPPFVRIEAPAAKVEGRVRFSFIVDEKQAEATPADLPAYLPVDANDPHRVADGARPLLGNADARAAREVAIQHPELARAHRARRGIRAGTRSTRSTTPPPARRWPAPGWPLFAMRRRRFAIAPTCRCAADRRTSSALRRADASCVSSCTTASTSTKSDRRAFDLVWPHIAGAGQGSFNERFAAPGYNTFSATRFPYTDLEQAGPDGSRDGILAAYRAESDAEGDLHEHVG